MDCFPYVDQMKSIRTEMAFILPNYLLGPNGMFPLCRPNGLFSLCGPNEIYTNRNGLLHTYLRTYLLGPNGLFSLCGPNEIYTNRNGLLPTLLPTRTEWTVFPMQTE